MVKEIQKDSQTLYVCEECGYAYKEKKWAQECQAWDQAHPGTCNVEIIQHGAPLEQDA
ncbi:MAG: hypothetical protein HYX80_09950 [Chloroflexi bacterium]|nr:hypothetical protein [Chloroflexota bacterium]